MEHATAQTIGITVEITETIELEVPADCPLASFLGGPFPDAGANGSTVEPTAPATPPADIPAPVVVALYEEPVEQAPAPPAPIVSDVPTPAPTVDDTPPAAAPSPADESGVTAQDAGAAPAPYDWNGNPPLV